MPLRAAKHIASSCSGAGISGAPPSPEKLSPATNSSTGRGDVSLAPPVATSSTFRSLSPYLKFRENATLAQDADGSGVASADEASEPSSTSPAFVTGLAGT